MEHQTMCTLEYEEIIKELSRYAVSYEGRKRIAELAPKGSLPVVARMLAETQEAKVLLQKGASVPLPSLEGIELVISLLGSGYLFSEQDFGAVARFLQSCSQLKKYMAGKTEIAPTIAAYALSLYEEQQLRSEIDRCILHGRIVDSASRELEKIRRKMESVKERIQKRMTTLLSKYGSYLQEHLVSTRDGRYVIPVKKEYHRMVKGSVLDQSTSGQTLFIAPEEIASMQYDLQELFGEEAREEAKILAGLIAMLESSSRELAQNIEITGTYDFLFAKGKYALAIGGNAVTVNDRGYIRINEGKHPKLLAGMVPLDIELGSTARGMIITGPNTGGKTVVLKTLGLLTLMVQSGLLVPVGEDSHFSVFGNIRAVIGDGQSLEQSLSTFSAQIASLVGMLETADNASLLLIDELAAGTDPAEGMALSIAILEGLSQAGAVLAVTTHFNELKRFAARTPGFQNARMEFDPATLKPLYKLTIGEAGNSYALEIAQRLGMKPQVVERSRILMAQRAEDKEAPALASSSDKSAANHATGIAVRKPGSEEIALDIREAEDKKDSAGETQPGSMGGQDEESGTKDADGRHERTSSKSNHGSYDSRGSESGQSGRSGQTAEDISDDGAPAGKTRFEVGDAVWVTSLRKMGIVYSLPDNLGITGVIVQKQKLKINHKRLRPYIAKAELYPADYDMDIVFDTKANRKLRKQFGKRHVEGKAIVREED